MTGWNQGLEDVLCLLVREDDVMGTQVVLWILLRGAVYLGAVRFGSV